MMIANKLHWCRMMKKGHCVLFINHATECRKGKVCIANDLAGAKLVVSNNLRQQKEKKILIQIKFI